MKRMNAFTPTATWSDVGQQWVPTAITYAPTWYSETPFTRATARRRARKLAAFVEHIDRRVVYERDAGICQICREPVEDVRWPDSLSPSLDHILALADGGRHEYSNIQLAHLRCNLRKSSKHKLLPRQKRGA